MIVKCVLSAQLQWLSRYYELRLVSCLGGFGFLLFYVLWMQPYQSLHSNVYVSSQYVWVVVTGLYGWVSICTEGAGGFVIAWFWVSYVALTLFGTFIVGVYARQIYLQRCAITHSFQIPVDGRAKSMGDTRPCYMRTKHAVFKPWSGWVGLGSNHRII